LVCGNISFRVANAKFQQIKAEVIVKAKKSGDYVAETFVFAFFIFFIGGIIATCGPKSRTELKENTHYQKNLVPERNA